ncbi:Primase C terminal 1 (PriCT-1) [Bacillus sp. OV166]|uniref:bifunctional DNA primase/polymerase n=1 Tax=Bacillus sp. OV166 TaxID=1882763 RepID=UPI000A2AB414|nr:bifunctional DNA primase/polymerase [Bacillus sp. OV166]SMQ60906.1 Primase C terminal 1 (PriCT-1) [Bacillus sp. OV166]
MNFSALSQNGRAAIAYANKLKWAVFPIYEPMDKYCSCQNPNCTSIGKHPRVNRGFKEATINLNLISNWWVQWPEANIGIATGKQSSLIAVDIDPRHGGEESLIKLIHEYRPLPKTVEAVTGGGGRHILFKPTCYIRNRSNLLPGIDIRGDGGYIVVAPSLHERGQVYEWDLSNHPLNVGIVDIPKWLLDLIQGERKTHDKRPASYWINLFQGVGEGERNIAATQITGYLLRRYIDPLVTYKIIQMWNDQNMPPLNKNELYTIVNSVAGIELERRRKGGHHG